MGKSSRRKKRDRSFAETPIRIVHEETGEVVEEFYDPKVAQFFSDEIAKGRFKTKEEITAFVNEGLEKLIAQRQKNAPHDGDTQHGDDLGAEYGRKMFAPIELTPEDEDKVANLLQHEHFDDGESQKS